MLQFGPLELTRNGPESQWHRPQNERIGSADRKRLHSRSPFAALERASGEEQRREFSDAHRSGPTRELVVLEWFGIRTPVAGASQKQGRDWKKRRRFG
jgi:hypothetical protein